MKQAMNLLLFMLMFLLVASTAYSYIYIERENKVTVNTTNLELYDGTADFWLRFAQAVKSQPPGESVREELKTGSVRKPARGLYVKPKKVYKTIVIKQPIEQTKTGRERGTTGPTFQEIKQKRIGDRFVVKRKTNEGWLRYAEMIKNANIQLNPNLAKMRTRTEG